jgi:hypothetical protein
VGQVVGDAKPDDERSPAFVESCLDKTLGKVLVLEIYWNEAHVGQRRIPQRFEFYFLSSRVIDFENRNG